MYKEDTTTLLNYWSISPKSDSSNNGNDLIALLPQESEKKGSNGAKSLNLLHSDKAFRDPEKWFWTIAQNPFIGAYRMMLDGRIIFSNNALAALLDFATPDQLNQDGNGLRPSDRKEWELLLHQLKRDGYVRDFKCGVRTRLGTNRTLLLSGSLEGESVFGTAIDISEKKQTESRLQAVREFTSTIQKCINLKEICTTTSEFLRIYGFPNYVGLFNAHGTEIVVQAAAFDSALITHAEQYLGEKVIGLTLPVSPECLRKLPSEIKTNQASGDPVTDFQSPVLPSLLFIDQNLAKIFEIKKSIKAPFVIVNQVIGYIEANVVSISAEEAHFIEVLAECAANAIHTNRLLTDIQTEKRDEQSLGDAVEPKYKSLEEIAKQLNEIEQFSMEHGPDDLDEENELCKKQMGAEAATNAQLQDKNNGITVENEADIRPKTLENIVAVEDVAQRLNPQDLLRLFEVMVYHTHDAVLFADLKGIVRFANPACEKMYGYKREQMIGKSLHVLFGDSYPLSSTEVYKKIHANGSWQGQWDQSSKHNGNNKVIQLFASSFRDSASRLVGFSCLGKDISQQKRLQTQLRQAQRMETIGTLSAGIAHDFKNFLSGILGYTTMILRELPRKNAYYNEIKAIEETSYMATDLANRLLTITRSDDSKKLVCSINQIIERTIGVLSRSINKNIEIKLSLPSTLPSVLCNPCQIEQIVMNLGLNAAHAMPQGGMMTIRTSKTNLDESYCASYRDLIPGDYVAISVKDTGTGIAPELQRKIFEPLFTTKEQDKGTGLGLSVVYSIVREHKGAIGLNSKEGSGSKFIIYLPLETTQKYIYDEQMTLEMELSVDSGDS